MPNRLKSWSSTVGSSPASSAITAGAVGGIDGFSIQTSAGTVLLTSVEKFAGWARASSLWPATFGLACCAIEMGAAFASPRYDVMRLGVIPFPASPRQADLVVIAGTVTDAYHRPMSNAFIRLVSSDPADNGKPLDVAADREGNVKGLRISPAGTFAGASGSGSPSFVIRFTVRIR